MLLHCMGILKARKRILIADDWNRENYPYKKLEYGKWELTIPPNSDGTPAIKHLSEIKVVFHT